MAHKQQGAQQSPGLEKERGSLSHSANLLAWHGPRETYQSPCLTHYGRLSAITLEEDGDPGGGGGGGGGGGDADAPTS